MAYLNGRKILTVVQVKELTPSLQSKTVNPSTSQQVITADSGYNGLEQVTVNAVTSAIDANIQAGNIKKDVTILGVTGTYEGGGGGADLDKLLDGTITTIESDTTTIRTSAFYQCTLLVSVTLPNLINIAQNAFNGCTSLPSISLPAATTINIQAFANCTALETVNLPNVSTLTGSNIFNGCTNLKTVTLGNINVNIPANLFYNCENLETINWTLPTASIASYSFGNNVFYNCKKIKNLTFTRLYQIGTSCFYHCTALETVDLGDLGVIPAQTFEGCTSLQSITLRKTGSICTLASTNAFNLITNQVIVYVPSDLIASYQTATNWITLYNGGNGKVNFVAIQ